MGSPMASWKKENDCFIQLFLFEEQIARLRGQCVNRIPFSTMCRLLVKNYDKIRVYIYRTDDLQKEA
jgi:hypothetical protein